MSFHSKSLPSAVLRPEAIKLTWAQCDHHQRHALWKLVGFLQSALEQLDREQERKRDCEGHTPEFYREATHNNTTLLNGSRGSGKTSLLKSLYHLVKDPDERKRFFSSSRLSSGNDPKLGDAVRRGVAGASTVDYDLWKNEIEQRLERLAGRTIWLNPLDSEILPGPTNLLAAILSRIEEAILPNRIDDDVEHPPLYQDQELNGLIQELRELMADVTLAWDGNLPERAQHVDPDTYAAEVIRAERARLSIVERLRVLLGRLWRAQQCRKSKLLILPIDDIDLSPARCLEQLRLSRMLNIPQLFIVMLGDLDEARDIVQTKMVGDFAAVAKIRLHDDITKLEAYKSHSEIAFDALKKMIPPAQRLSLADMGKWETLEFRLPGQEQTVHDLLKAIPLFPISSLTSGESDLKLADIVFGNLEPDENIRTTSGGILRAVPRVIVDLWLRLLPMAERIGSKHEQGNLTKNPNPDVSSEVLEEKRRRNYELLHCLKSLFCDMLERINAGDGTDKLLDVFFEGRNFTWTILPKQFGVRIESYQRVELVVMGQSRRIYSFYDGDWEIYDMAAQVNTLGSNASFTALSLGRNMSYFTLCHDTVVALHESREGLKTVSPQGDALLFVSNSIKLSEGAEFQLRFPNPSLSMFIEWDCLLENWSHLIDQMQPRGRLAHIQRDPTTIAMLWLWGCLKFSKGDLRSARNTFIHGDSTEFGRALYDGKIDICHSLLMQNLRRACEDSQAMDFKTSFNYASKAFSVFAPEHGLLIDRLLGKTDPDVLLYILRSNRAQIQRERCLALALGSRECQGSADDVFIDIFVPYIADEVLKDWEEDVNSILKKYGASSLPGWKDATSGITESFSHPDWKNIAALAQQLEVLIEYMDVHDQRRHREWLSLVKDLSATGEYLPVRKSGTVSRQKSVNAVRLFFLNEARLTRKDLLEAGVREEHLYHSVLYPNRGRE